MKLDQYIRIKMLELNKKYITSLVEVSCVKDNKFKKTYTFNYRKKKSSPKDNQKETFFNKRDLVSWLLCLE